MAESAFKQLTDDNPVYKELKKLFVDGKLHATETLANPTLSSEERHFYSGVLHNLIELDYAVEERRDLKKVK
jgi:hypothetical protein